MKRKLLFLFTSLLISSSIVAQVVANQVDDFDDGTVQDWIIGPSGTNVPTNETVGGYTGDGDNYLHYVTTGNPNGPGSKVVIYNDAGNWTGDFTNRAVEAIKFHARADTNNLELRVAFEDGGGNRICTTIGQSVTAGSGWQSVTIDVEAADFTLLGAGDVATILTNVAVMRILHSTVPVWAPAAIDATLDIDNIEAYSPTLGIDDIDVNNEFSLYPNPGSIKMNISLPSVDSAATVEVFNVLGKRIYIQTLNQVNKAINVSEWSSGIYLVKVSNGTTTQTKRFVKQ